MTTPCTPQPAAPGAPRERFGVLVVDDHAAIRSGVARLIDGAALPLHCAGTAANGAEALAANDRLRPQVVVLDADLGGEDGLALIPALSRRAAVLVLTSNGDAATRNRAARLGAFGLVEKHEPARDLLRAIVDAGATRGLRADDSGPPRSEPESFSGVPGQRVNSPEA